MATFKVTLLFQFQDKYGWSESFYTNRTWSSINSDPVKPYVLALAAKRAGCLSIVGSVIAARVSDVANPNAIRLLSFNVPGTRTGIIDNSNPDVANLAPLAVMSSVSGAKRSYFLRGLIDQDVVNGQFTATFSGPAPYNTWLQEITSNTYCIRDLVPAGNVGVTTISGITGQCVNADPTAFKVGDLVRVRTRVAGGGKKVYWTGKVLFVGVNSINLKGWKWGDCEGGTISPLGVTYSPVNPILWVIPQRCRTRQTGRVFGLPRGRASKRT
jgi:hypothetical protein